MIPSKHRIGRHDRQLLLERLRNEQAIERVAVVEWQCGDPHDVPEIDWQHREAIRGHLLGKEPIDRYGELDFSQAQFDRDLPSAREAEQALVGRLGNRAARPCRELVVETRGYNAGHP